MLWMLGGCALYQGGAYRSTHGYKYTFLSGVFHHLSTQTLSAHFPDGPIGPGHTCTAGGSCEPQVEHFMALFAATGATVLWW